MNAETANRLAQMRTQSGFSREELAEKLGVGTETVASWESAEAEPGIGALIALSALYGVSVDELLRADDANPVGGDAARDAGPRDDRQAVGHDSDAAYEQWRSDQRRWLRRFPYPVVVVGAYLCIGFLFGWWHPGWLLFLTIPIYYGVIQ